MYRLLFQNRLAEREPLVTQEPVLVVGREAACQLRLTEPGVSDRHAAIERRADGYYVRDLESANGVRVNGQLVAQQRLESGDDLELGSARLRFEIVHAVPRTRRAFDLWQAFAALAVLAFVAGQVWLLAWVVAQPHPRQSRRAPRTATNAVPPVESAAPVSTVAVPAPAVVPEPAAVPAPVGVSSAAVVPRPIQAAVLDRKLQIERVVRSGTDGAVMLSIQVKARVGERELDPGAAAIAVQFLVRRGGAEPELAPAALWLTIGPWENFSSKTFAARFPGTAEQYGGYVVRTYYHGQLQDAAAEPATALARVGEPSRSR